SPGGKKGRCAVCPIASGNARGGPDSSQELASQARLDHSLRASQYREGRSCPFDIGNRSIGAKSARCPLRARGSCGQWHRVALLRIIDIKSNVFERYASPLCAISGALELEKGPRPPDARDGAGPECGPVGRRE